MKSRLLLRFLMASALVSCASLAGAADKANPALPKTDAEIGKSVTHEIRMYPRYTLYDYLDFRVTNGQVELMGAVTQPFKKSDIERTVAKLPGVSGVTDSIKVLPLSPS